jgi:hypothetical protein
MYDPYLQLMKEKKRIKSQGFHKDKKNKKIWRFLYPPSPWGNMWLRLKLFFDNVNIFQRLGDLYPQSPSKFMEGSQVKPFKTFISRVIHSASCTFIALHILSNSVTTC